MSGLRLTPVALSRLEDIIYWTIQTFGAEQAASYEADLYSALDALAEGERTGRSCAELMQDLGGATALHFLRVKSPYVIYRDDDAQLVILDFIHSARDLPALLEQLQTDGGQ